MDHAEFLTIYLNEHYAHARDHENLRAQVSSILSASSIFLMGILSVRDAPARHILAASGLVCILSLLNLVMNWLHSNRAKAHIDTAGEIREHVENAMWPQSNLTAASVYRTNFKTRKKGSLTIFWYALPTIIFGSGILMLLDTLCMR